MASKIFRDSLVIGVTLQEIRQRIVAVADELNNERAALGISRFATVYVGPLLQGPKPLTGVLFLVSYSDYDYDAPERVNEALQNMTRATQEDSVFYLKRDPYCA